MSVVSIERNAPNSYTVRSDGKHTCGLTSDEALGTIASWLYADKPLFRMYYDTDSTHVCFVASQHANEVSS